MSIEMYCQDCDYPVSVLLICSHCDIMLCSDCLNDPDMHNKGVCGPEGPLPEIKAGL